MNKNDTTEKRTRNTSKWNNKLSDFAQRQKLSQTEIRSDDFINFARLWCMNI